MALTQIDTGGIKDDAVTDAKLPANSVGNSEMKDDAVGVAELSATGTASSSTFLRGDNSWVTPTDTNTQLSTEEVQDIVGAMFTGNTETNITATYQDSDGTIDLVSTDTNTQIGGATGVDFNDGVKARFGTGNDLEIYHDASDSYIKEAGVGELQIWSDTNLALRSDSFRLNNAANDENMIKADANGSVELYYDNVKTFSTNTLGIIVYGTEGGTAQIDLAADESDDNADKWKVGCTDNGHFFISNKDSGAWDTNIECNRSGNVELYYDASKKIETISNGVKVHTNLYAEGTGQVSLNIGSTDAGGAAIFFDGDSNGDWSGNDYSSIVHNSDGNLVIKANSPGTANCYIQVGSDGDYAALFNEGGSAILRYDNSTKIETTNLGAQITGELSLTTHLKLLDDQKVVCGAGEDLLIYHDGSESHIYDAGTGSLRLRSNAFKVMNAADNEAMIYANENGAVELYYDNTKKLETAGPGIRVAMQTWGSDPSASNAGAVLGSPNTGGFICAAGGTTDSDHALFINPNGIVGRIRTNGSGTSFNTSSDYRLKENQVSISDGITRLKQLKPYRFNFKSDASKTVDGFFAHEVSPTVPEAVTGEKDAVELEDNDRRDIKKGDIIPQGIDHSKLVPLLTAALQEAITKIETLETKVAALEAK